MGGGLEERVFTEIFVFVVGVVGERIRPPRGGLAGGRDVSGGVVGNVGGVRYGEVYEEVSSGFEDVDAERFGYFVPVRSRDGRRGRGGSEFRSEAKHGEQSEQRRRARTERGRGDEPRWKRSRGRYQSRGRRS